MLLSTGNSVLQMDDHQEGRDVVHPHAATCGCGQLCRLHHFRRSCAKVVVNTLRNFQHSFLKVDLFYRDYHGSPEWHSGIRREIYQHTWSNNFLTDCKDFIDGLSDPGTRFKQKLKYYSWQGHICYYDLLKSHCRNRDVKLWYAAIMAALEYDKLHKCFSCDVEPNRLYSLIRECPDYLKGV